MGDWKHTNENTEILTEVLALVGNGSIYARSISQLYLTLNYEYWEILHVPEDHTVLPT